MTILTNGICINQNPSWRMRCIKNLWDSEILMDHRIPIRRLNQELINKNKNLPSCDADPKEKIKESEKIDKYLNLAREMKKETTVEHEGDGDTNCSRCTWNGPQRLERKTVGIGYQRKKNETFQTTALLGLARILRRVLETWGDLLSFTLFWKTTS